MRERLGGDDAYDDGDDETRKSQKVGGAPSLSGSRNCHGREPVSRSRFCRRTVLLLPID